MNYDTHKVSCDLQKTTRDDKFFLENTRDILKILLTKTDDKYMWKSFSWDTGEGMRTDTFKTFPEYLKKWSKFTLDDFRKLFKDDIEMADMLDMVSMNPTGLYNIQDSAPTGTSKDAGLRRLRKDKPELHAQVLADELSVNAAMIQAGFRRKMMSVPGDSYEDAISAVNKYYGRV